MKLFKNPELRSEYFIKLVIILACVVLCFLMISPLAGLICLILGAVLLIIQLFFDNKRYKEIAKFSDSIDKLLHGESRMSLEEFSEGELAILSSEVNKLTVRLEEQNSALIADKIRLSEAMADISHQLKTPLTSMSLTYPMLSEEELEYSKRRELVRELKKNTERLSTLVGVLLKISKLDAGTAVLSEDKLSVKELVKKATENLLIPLEVRGIDLVVEVGEESLVGDILWQSEAVGNVVKNCMEHTEAGGRIEIKAFETPIFTRIEIIDSGKGISEKDLPHIFERFYKGSNSSMDSYGIGLALARTIITAQHGTIAAGNCVNGGAQFTITYYKQII